MSNTEAGLRRKIQSAQDLQSVVRTMKTIAASSLSQYENSVRALVDYSRAVELGLGACFQQSKSSAVIAKTRPRSRARTVGAVVFGSDQGLVGQFNEVITRYASGALGALSGKAKVWAVGERVRARLADSAMTPIKSFSVPNSVKAITPLITQILLEIVTLQSEGERVELYLFYHRPTSRSAYAPITHQLLPLDEQWERNLAERHPPGAPSGTLVPEILGEADATLRAFISEYLFVSLFRACAESLASENASRAAAMERADKNINELLEDLSGTFHRLRQGSIDEELFDVVAGFEALVRR